MRDTPTTSEIQQMPEDEEIGRPPRNTTWHRHALSRAAVSMLLMTAFLGFIASGCVSSQSPMENPGSFHLLVSGDERDAQEDIEDARLAMERTLRRAGGTISPTYKANYVVEAHLEYRQPDPMTEKQPMPHYIRVTARRASDGERFSARGPGFGSTDPGALGAWGAKELLEELGRRR